MESSSFPDPARYCEETRRLKLDPRTPAFFRNPYPAYAAMHAAGGLVFWEDYGFWCVTGFEAVNRLLRDRRFGREGPVRCELSAEDRAHLADFDAIEAHSMLEREPPVHTRLRTLVNRAFVSRQVERLRPRVEALAHALIDRIEGDGSGDLLPAFAEPIPVTIISGMLGVPVEMAPQLLDWSHRMVAMYQHGRTRETEESANRAAREFSAFLRDCVVERRRRPGDDILSLLIAAYEDGERLGEEELISSAILLLNAGHEATVHQIGNAIRVILLQGGDARRFFASPERTIATVEECLRIDPPLHLFTRYAYETLDLGNGVGVREGEQVGLLLGAANHDPQAFVEPQSFRPGRPDQKNVSFGAGIHFCIGAPLARLELQVALKVLFDRLPGLSLTDEPRWRDSFHFHGLERLVCSWPR
jgi:unspecific monooxygenase